MTKEERRNIKARDEYVAKLLPAFLRNDWVFERISDLEEDYYDHVDAIYRTSQDKRIKVQLKLCSFKRLGFRDIDMRVYSNANEFELTESDYLYKVFLSEEDIINNWEESHIVKAYSLNIKAIKTSGYHIIVDSRIKGIFVNRKQMFIGMTPFGSMSFPHSINRYIPGAFEIK